MADYQIPAGETVVARGRLYRMGGLTSTKRVKIDAIVTDVAVHLVGGHAGRQTAIPFSQVASLVAISTRNGFTKVPQLSLQQTTSNQFGANTEILQARPDAIGEAEAVFAAIRGRVGRERARTGAERGDFIAEIERLAELRKQGLLSDAEFTQAKAKLLS